MKPATPLEYVDKAIALAIDRQKRIPGFTIYATIVDQLKYIRAVFDDTEKDKSKLHRLTIGAIASKEFEENDPELARVLKDAYYVAIQSARGLTIQLPD
ncbi:immunity protein Tsi6 family protein [Pseudomonas sp. 51_B]|uniref:immunity protein Tsi6 family protein n=1 Tax=Pseudomonas sp. 51_B TaxID=2813573 RepID=UPI001A9E586D|nr:immunity protein Tsi6 family protein [Pseudomonas sp. 51_B]